MNDDRYLQLYEDSNGEWRWRLKHRNGNVLADSGESYENRKDMLDTLAHTFGDGEEIALPVEYLE